MCATTGSALIGAWRSSHSLRACHAMPSGPMSARLNNRKRAKPGFLHSRKRMLLSTHAYLRRINTRGDDRRSEQPEGYELRVTGVSVELTQGVLMRHMSRYGRVLDLALLDIKWNTQTMVVRYKYRDDAEEAMVWSQGVTRDNAVWKVTAMYAGGVEDARCPGRYAPAAECARGVDDGQAYALAVRRHEEVESSAQPEDWVMQLRQSLMETEGGVEAPAQYVPAMSEAAAAAAPTEVTEGAAGTERPRRRKRTSLYAHLAGRAPIGRMDLMVFEVD